MFKIKHSRYGTYYVQTREQAERLREERRRLHNESGYRISEIK